MAMIQKNVLWDGIGGYGSIQQPDRVTISCPKCGQETGNSKGPVLMLFDDEGILKVGILCDCGAKRSVAKIESK